MQTKKLVRVGLAAVMVGGGLGAMSAVGGCGDDSATGGGGKDAAADNSLGDTGVGGDTGTGDTGNGDVAVEAGPPAPKVFITHASVSTNSPPFRFCFGLDSAGDGSVVTVTGGIHPFPDVVTVPIPGAPAGLFPGFGGSTGSSAALSAFNLAQLNASAGIALYALNALSPAVAAANADAGATEAKCEDLIGADGKGGASPKLTLGTDYWYAGTVAKGTLQDSGTWLTAVTGCLPGVTGNETAFCGANYDAAKGNLALKVWKLDQSVIDGGAIGAQVAHASPAWDTAAAVIAQQAGVANYVSVSGFYSFTTPPAPDGGDDGGDAATDGGASGPVFTPTIITDPTTGGVKFGDLKPATLASVPGVTDDMAHGFFAAIVDTANGSLVGPPLPYPLPAIDQLSGNTSFKDGHGYVFVLIGDPLLPTYINLADGGASDPDAGGVFNGKSAHFLGFSTANP